MPWGLSSAPRESRASEEGLPAAVRSQCGQDECRVLVDEGGRDQTVRKCTLTRWGLSGEYRNISVTSTLTDKSETVSGHLSKGVESTGLN